MRIFSALLLLTGALLIQGCATPRYVTETRYEVPESGEGQACIATCKVTQDACRSECEAAWKACVDQVEPQVDGAYGQALEAYAHDLKDYRLSLERVHWNAWMDWGWGGWRASPWAPYPWPAYVPLPISPGDPPTKDAVRDGLIKTQCKDDCGCQPKYDDCFKVCGGRVVTETRCVANCPDGR